jgi:hypothetical protein
MCERCDLKLGDYTFYILAEKIFVCSNGFMTEIQNSDNVQLVYFEAALQK